MRHSRGEVSVLCLRSQDNVFLCDVHSEGGGSQLLLSPSLFWVSDKKKTSFGGFKWIFILEPKLHEIASTRLTRSWEKFRQMFFFWHPPPPSVNFIYLTPVMLPDTPFPLFTCVVMTSSHESPSSAAWFSLGLCHLTRSATQLGVTDCVCNAGRCACDDRLTYGVQCPLLSPPPPLSWSPTPPSL